MVLTQFGSFFATIIGLLCGVPSWSTWQVFNLGYLAAVSYSISMTLLRDSWASSTSNQGNGQAFAFLNLLMGCACGELICFAINAEKTMRP
jgi:hypothetical protein